MPVSIPFRDDVKCVDVAQTIITGQSLTVTVWQGLQHHLALRRAASHGACTAFGLAGGPDGTPFSTEQQLLVEIRGSGAGMLHFSNACKCPALQPQGRASVHPACAAYFQAASEVSCAVRQLHAPSATCWTASVDV